MMACNSRNLSLNRLVYGVVYDCILVNMYILDQRHDGDKPP